MHGPNLFPPEQDAPGLRAAVLEYMDEMSALARALLRAIYKSLEVPEDHYEALFEEPTTLFRCFSYPPNDEKWGAKSYAAARLGPRRRRRGWDRISAVAAAAATRPRPRDATRSTQVRGGRALGLRVPHHPQAGRIRRSAGQGRAWGVDRRAAPRGFNEGLRRVAIVA